MARKVDVSLLAQLNAGAENQEVKKGGFSRTTDPAFPLFTTPINKNILVYIPMTNVVSTENGSEMKLLTTHTHTYRENNYTGMIRCISGLEGGVFSSELGYDGSCPACAAVADCWELYNRKIKAEADKLGIDPQNDTGDVLKSARRKILDEMDMKSSEEYVTFPIVIIPTEGNTIKPAPDAINNLQVQFVVWTKKRYEKNIIGGLSNLMNNPGHPGGLFWQWKFTYNTEGKPANARDSAKNAVYTVIDSAEFLKLMESGKPALEKAAAAFTNEKAVEVIISNQYMYKEDLDAKVNKIMAKTRNLLAISDTEGVGSAAPAMGAGVASFGALPTGDLGIEASDIVGAKFGE